MRHCSREILNAVITNGGYPAGPTQRQISFWTTNLFTKFVDFKIVVDWRENCRIIREDDGVNP